MNLGAAQRRAGMGLFAQIAARTGQVSTLHHPMRSSTRMMGDTKDLILRLQMQRELFESLPAPPAALWGDGTEE